MNSKITAIFAAVALCLAALLGVAVAGINPNGNLGLPAVDLTTGDNNFYVLTAAGVPGKQASVMCVACHTRNPGARDAYRSANGFNYTGSHFVTRTFADTSKGGGYSDGSSGKTRLDRQAAGTAIYMADNTSGNITVANGWYGLPKYGWLNSGVPDNTTTPRTATNPQMICESCHNITKNIGPAKLLASAFANGAATSGGGKGTQVPNLCIGCHADMDANVNAEWQYHPLTTGTWGGTQHHRNTPGTALYFGSATQIASGTHDMGRIDPTYYNQNIGGNIYQMWAAGPGGLTAGRAIDFTSNPQRVKPMADNNQIQPSAATLLCTNCHRAHNADGTAGATILMRGTMAFTTAMGTGTAPSDAATAHYGVRRMEDKGGRGSAFSSTNPLCLACHL